MKAYGTTPRDVDNPCLGNGDYNRYGHSKQHRRSYSRSERVIKRRERFKARLEIKNELAS